MVPASLRIRRDELKPKPRPKGPEIGSGFGLAHVSKPATVAPLPVASDPSGAPPAQIPVIEQSLGHYDILMKTLIYHNSMYLEFEFE